MNDNLVRPQDGSRLSKIRSFLAAHSGTIFFFLSPLAIFMAVEILEYGGTDSECMHPQYLAFWVNLMLYYGVYLLVRAMTGKTRFTLNVLNIIFLIFGIVNYYSIDIRNEPVVPWDILAARTAGEAMSGFTWWPLPAQVVCCTIAVILWCVISHFLKFEKKVRLRQRLEMFAASFVLLLSFGLIAAFGQGNFYVSTWRQVTANRRNGMALNFCMNLGALYNEKPDGYSVETASGILSSVKDEPTAPDTTKKPNIIVVMDETFADLSSLGDLGLTNTDDVMPFVHSLAEDDNAITGELVVPAYGGGTCNSEYEFLTSNTYAFFKAGSYPMLQYVNNQTQSIASVLKEQGYATTAIHPYYASGWGRNRAYPLLGFDQFLSVDDFPDDTTEYLRRYVSDKSSFQKIIDTYESKKNDPMFVFNVTIQNHCGYDTVYDNFPEPVEFQSEDLYPYTKQYLSLIQESDSALEQLVNYFKQVDEPTIIVMFGDHMPYIENSFYDKLIGYDTKLTDAEINMKKHTVPFFLWANYDIDGYDAGTLSCNYLAPLTLDTAGLPMSEYQSYVYSLRDKYPVIAESGCVNSSGIFVPLEMAARDLRDYKIVQYQYVFDKKTLRTTTSSDEAFGSGRAAAAS